MLEKVWEGREKRVAPRTQQLPNCVVICQLILHLLLLVQGAHGAKQPIDLDDQLIERRNVREKTFRNQDTTVVFASVGSLTDIVT